VRFLSLDALATVVVSDLGLVVLQGVYVCEILDVSNQIFPRTQFPSSIGDFAKRQIIGVCYLVVGQCGKELDFAVKPWSSLGACITL